MQRNVKPNEIRVNKETGKVEICVEVLCTKERLERRWVDYDTMLFKSCYGQCDHSDDIYPLSVFRDTFMTAQIKKVKIENQIKIRYAYIGSPTNMKEDPTYYETLGFKILTVEDLEQRSSKTTLEELITDGNEALIEVLGRDRCTGRVDMGGNDIYENDRIRWYADSGGYIDEIVDQKTRWVSTFCTKDCKVIGAIYDKKGIDKYDNKK